MLLNQTEKRFCVKHPDQELTTLKYYLLQEIATFPPYKTSPKSVKTEIAQVISCPQCGYMESYILKDEDLNKDLESPSI